MDRGRNKNQHAQRDLAFNISPLTYSKLAQQERQLKTQLETIRRETYYNLIDAVQKQQVIGRQLVLLDRKLSKDRKASVSAGRDCVSAIQRKKKAKEIYTTTLWRKRTTSAPPRSSHVQTLEYYRNLLQPSVLRSKVENSEKGSICWADVAERKKSAASREPSARPTSPSKWYTIEDAVTIN